MSDTQADLTKRARETHDRLNGFFSMTPEERADWVMGQMLEGTMVGDGNRGQVRDYLRDHFHYLHSEREAAAAELAKAQYEVGRWKDVAKNKYSIDDIVRNRDEAAAEARRAAHHQGWDNFRDTLKARIWEHKGEFHMRDAVAIINTHHYAEHGRALPSHAPQEETR